MKKDPTSVDKKSKGRKRKGFFPIKKKIAVGVGVVSILPSSLALLGHRRLIPRSGAALLLLFLTCYCLDLSPKRTMSASATPVAAVLKHDCSAASSNPCQDLTSPPNVDNVGGGIESSVEDEGGRGSQYTESLLPPTTARLTTTAAFISGGGNGGGRRRPRWWWGNSGGSNGDDDDNGEHGFRNPARRLGRRRRWVWGAACASIAVGLPLTTELYSRSGSREIVRQCIDLALQPHNSEAKTDWSKAKHVTIVFHGAGGTDSYTDELMSQLRKHRSSSSYMVDWSSASKNTLQASFNGQRIGRGIGTKLLSLVSSSSAGRGGGGGGEEEESVNVKMRRRLDDGKKGSEVGSLRTIHIIGISVGAFAADACARQLYRELEEEEEEEHISDTGDDGVVVQLTLLDPFTARGVLDYTYGRRHFGRDVDYAQQYLNTDDPVPSTNTPLKHCGCYDVTSIRPHEIFGHDWPLVYYSKLSYDEVGKIVDPSNRLDRGEVVKVLLPPSPSHHQTTASAAADTTN